MFFIRKRTFTSNGLSLFNRYTWSILFGSVLYVVCGATVFNAFFPFSDPIYYKSEASGSLYLSFSIGFLVLGLLVYLKLYRTIHDQLICMNVLMKMSDHHYIEILFNSL